MSAALLMGSVLAACGGGDEGSSDDETYTVGYIGALTGPVGASGVIALNGLKAGAEYANTLDGPTFKVVSRDSKGDPSAGANLARELAQSGVDAIFAGSTDIAAIQPVLNQYKILGADSGGVTALLSKLGKDNEFPWTFSPTTAAGNNTIVPQVRFLQEVSGNKIGELADTGPFGAGTTALTDTIVKEQFPDVELIKQTFPATASSVTAQLEKLRAQGAESLLLWTYGAPLVMVMQNLDRIGWYPYIGAPLGAGDPSVVEATPEKLKGKIAAGGIAAAQVDGSGVEPSPLIAEFFKRYTKISGGKTFTGLDTVANYTFDWVVSLQAAIDGAGSTDSAKVRDWLIGGTEIQGSQGLLKFGDKAAARIGISLENTTVYDPTKPCDEAICSAVETP
ncbi:hypothetical protein GCM10022234_23250 [Aeromicrobium panaciterrae]|uniref:ABC transporter substrate-binding protein n=1 Tax=Aeromicrobium panaciterrae TaxID=363861 RepID=UPI0031E1E51B